MYGITEQVPQRIFFALENLLVSWCLLTRINTFLLLEDILCFS